MYTSRNYDSLPYRNLLRLRCKVCYYDHLTVVPCNSLAKNSFPYSVFIIWGAYLLQEFYAVTVSIRETMSKVDLIIIVLEKDLEGQSMV